MENKFMEEAIKQALIAKKNNEVPIGAVIVKNGEIISRGRNMREKKQNALLHAEIVAIDKACKKLHSWRLDNCVIYVTVEPCPMCAGAILNARIKKVVFGASDCESGFCGGKANIMASQILNHSVLVGQGGEGEKCRAILQAFFKEKRKK